MQLSSKALSLTIKNAIECAPLSDNSKTKYLRHLEIIAEESGHADIWTGIINHEISIAALQKKYESRHASLHLHSASVLSAFKHVPSLKELAPKSIAAWRALNKAAQGPLALHSLSSQPTPRQAQGWIPFTEITAKRETLLLGSDARLLLSMYTLIPTLRRDMHTLRIYPSPPLETSGNYLLLPPLESANMPPPLSPSKTTGVFLTITLTKTGGLISQELPEALVYEIRESLARRPRDYLFVSPRDRLPFKSETTFGNWANLLLQRTFGRPLSLVLIRHAYISNLKFDEMTHHEKLDVANLMGHSVDMQSRYKFIFKEEGKGAAGGAV